MTDPLLAATLDRRLAELEAHTGPIASGFRDHVLQLCQQAGGVPELPMLGIYHHVYLGGVAWERQVLAELLDKMAAALRGQAPGGGGDGG